MLQSKHILDVIVLIIGLLVCGCGLFYRRDTCIVTSCHEQQCSAYAVQLYGVNDMQNDNEYVIYLPYSHFVVRDTWVISSCGACYSCTEIL